MFDDDNDILHLFLPAAGEHEERLDWVQRLYVREAKDSRDNLNYLTLEKRYKIIPSLYIHQ